MFLPDISFQETPNLVYLKNMFIQKSKMFASQNLGNHFAVNNICFAICEVQSRNLFPEYNLQKNPIYSV